MPNQRNCAAATTAVSTSTTVPTVAAYPSRPLLNSRKISVLIMSFQRCGFQPFMTTSRSKT